MKKQTNNKKKMTITEVGELVITLSKKVSSHDKKFLGLDESINQLAVATNKGFEQVHGRIDGLTKNVDIKIEALQSDMNENFAKVRQGILEMHDTFATKEELKALL